MYFKKIKLLYFTTMILCIILVYNHPNFSVFRCSRCSLRAQVLADNIISQLHDQLAAVGVDFNRLTATNQTSCDVTTWGFVNKMNRGTNVLLTILEL